MFARGIELPAQAADEDLYDVAVPLEILVVDVLGQAGLGDHLPGVQEQVLQHLVLEGGQLGRRPLDTQFLRGGIQGVPGGQIEAARACGMSYALRTRRIVLPQAIRIAWPAYGNEIVLLLKSSALVSTIAVWDLMGETRSIFSRTYSLDVFVYAGLIYFGLTFMLTRVFSLIERRLGRHLPPARAGGGA